MKVHYESLTGKPSCNVIWKDNPPITTKRKNKVTCKRCLDTTDYDHRELVSKILNKY